MLNDIIMRFRFYKLRKATRKQAIERINKQLNK